MKQSIYDNEEYYKIFEFILSKKGKARSYEITKKFGITTRRRSVQNDEIKVMRRNMSKKLQTLKEKGLIRVIDTKSRGRHGRYSIYDIDKKSLCYNFLFEFIESSALLEQYTMYIAHLESVHDTIYNHLIEIVKIIKHREEEVNIVEIKTINKLFLALKSFISFRGLFSLGDDDYRKEVQETFIYYQENQMQNRLFLNKDNL